MTRHEELHAAHRRGDTATVERLEQEWVDSLKQQHEKLFVTAGAVMQDVPEDKRSRRAMYRQLVQLGRDARNLTREIVVLKAEMRGLGVRK